MKSLFFLVDWKGEKSLEMFCFSIIWELRVVSSSGLYD